jgi:hypothetical protein
MGRTGNLREETCHEIILLDEIIRFINGPRRGRIAVSLNGRMRTVRLARKWKRFRSFVPFPHDGNRN